MPKKALKFNASMRAEFPFIKPVDENDSEVFCCHCSSKFDIANGRKKVELSLRNTLSLENTRKLRI